MVKNDRRSIIKAMASLGISPLLFNVAYGRDLVDQNAITQTSMKDVKNNSSNSLSNRMTHLLQQPTALGEYFRKSSYIRGVHAPQAIDLTFGNPHEPPVPAITAELYKQLEPKNAAWFAYKRNEKPARQAVVGSLRASTKLEFGSKDISLTNGATAGLAMILTSVIDPGDEVIYLNPPWFGYQPLITAAGGVPKLVNLKQDFDLDIEALSKAMTARTRAVIINSPHNPSGRIFDSSSLKKLSALLTQKSKANGRPIYLLSDESYRRIIFDNKEFSSPISFYPYSFLVYTYGKTLLTPGQRLGYVALAPSMPDKTLMRRAMSKAQMLTGWCYPNALLQYALPKLESISIDVTQLQKRRDFVYEKLHKAGYQVIKPQGTFYILVKSPDKNDFWFSEKLAAKKLFVLPGETLSAPGYFRITLTATDEMLERAMPILIQSYS